MECPERLYIQLEDLERGDSADGDSSGVHHMLSENGKVIVVNLADNVALESQRRHVDAVESGQRAPRAEGSLPHDVHCLLRHFCPLTIELLSCPFHIGEAEFHRGLSLSDQIIAMRFPLQDPARLLQRPQAVYVRGEWRLQHVDDHGAQSGCRGGAQADRIRME